MRTLLPTGSPTKLAIYLRIFFAVFFLTLFGRLLLLLFSRVFFYVFGVVSVTVFLALNPLVGVEVSCTKAVFRETERIDFFADFLFLAFEFDSPTR
jgi:hypothetical protein